MITLYRKRRAVQARREWPSRVFARSCFGVFLAALILGLAVNVAAWSKHPEKPGRPLNVIFVTWDSTRADHLSCYGYSRPTSPHLDEFAKDAVLFETAISQHNWTRPSYTSMFTGLHNWDLPGHRLELPQLTLAEVLKSNGYRTFSYVQNPNLDAELDFNQGFDFYSRLSGSLPSQSMNHFALKRIDSISRHQDPLFLFIHYQEPHYPYREDNPFVDGFLQSRPHLLSEGQINRIMRSNGKKGWDATESDAQEKVQYLLDMYDASIRNTDEALGELIGVLKKKGLWENSLIIFNSDHGDEFCDRGQFGHAHKNLHPELTFVPFVIRFPNELGISPQRISVPVQNLDIFPTVLGVTGIPQTRRLSGRNLELPSEGV